MERQPWLQTYGCFVATGHSGKYLGVVATKQVLDVIGRKILKELDEAGKKTEYATRLAG